MSDILLRCPKCHKAETVPRDEFDPPRAARVEIQCPECNAGDFDSPHYFAADGSELDWEKDAA
jgi:hypothetical protein